MGVGEGGEGEILGVGFEDAELDHFVGVVREHGADEEVGHNVERLVLVHPAGYDHGAVAAVQVGAEFPGLGFAEERGEVDAVRAVLKKPGRRPAKQVARAILFEREEFRPIVACAGVGRHGFTPKHAARNNADVVAFERLFKEGCEAAANGHAVVLAELRFDGGAAEGNHLGAWQFAGQQELPDQDHVLRGDRINGVVRQDWADAVDVYAGVARGMRPAEGMAVGIFKDRKVGARRCAEMHLAVGQPGQRMDARL